MKQKIAENSKKYRKVEKVAKRNKMGQMEGHRIIWKQMDVN